jgi:Lon protease-like protein
MTGERTKPTVALFPLANVVQFPTAPFTYHIFEPRYRTMFADCIAQNIPIAVVLCEPAAHHSAPQPLQNTMQDSILAFPSTGDEYPLRLPHDVGTLLSIDSHFIADDGRALIQGFGGARIHVTGIVQRSPYLIAEWAGLPEVPSTANIAARHAFTFVYERYIQVMRNVGELHRQRINWSEDDDTLSRHIAYAFQLAPALKQMLLTMNTNARMRTLIRLLRTELRTIPKGNVPARDVPPWSWN